MMVPLFSTPQIRYIYYCCRMCSACSLTRRNRPRYVPVARRVYRPRTRLPFSSTSIENPPFSGSSQCTSLRRADRQGYLRLELITLRRSRGGPSSLHVHRCVNTPACCSIHSSRLTAPSMLEGLTSENKLEGGGR